MSSSKEEIKEQIIAALSHPEAEEGLYFRNFTNLHEEDERNAVEGDEIEILDALKDLISEERVTIDESGDEVVFFLVENK